MGCEGGGASEGGCGGATDASTENWPELYREKVSAGVSKVRARSLAATDGDWGPEGGRGGGNSGWQFGGTRELRGLNALALESKVEDGLGGPQMLP